MEIQTLINGVIYFKHYIQNRCDNELKSFERFRDGEKAEIFEKT